MLTGIRFNYVLFPMGIWPWINDYNPCCNNEATETIEIYTFWMDCNADCNMIDENIVSENDVQYYKSIYMHDFSFNEPIAS